jgi:desulfoferrodoxin (superoxide reductase-like protein)
MDKQKESDDVDIQTVGNKVPHPNLAEHQHWVYKLLCKHTNMDQSSTEERGGMHPRHRSFIKSKQLGELSYAYLGQRPRLDSQSCQGPRWPLG